MRPDNKPIRIAEQRAAEAAIRRQHASNPIQKRPATSIGQREFSQILDLITQFKSARESQDLTLNEVAERIGIDAPALSRLETGKMLNPTLATLLKWAEAVGRKLEVELAQG